MPSPTPKPKKSESELPEYLKFVQTHRTKLWQATEKGYAPRKIAKILRKAGLEVRPILLEKAMLEVLGAK